METGVPKNRLVFSCRRLEPSRIGHETWTGVIGCRVHRRPQIDGCLLSEIVVRVRTPRGHQTEPTHTSRPSAVKEQPMTSRDNAAPASAGLELTSKPTVTAVLGRVHPRWGLPTLRLVHGTSARIGSLTLGVDRGDFQSAIRSSSSFAAGTKPFSSHPRAA
jgi:hypothetical protein